jgi:DNA-directed RNA polymerase specialized sigma24 family protein/CheY-like chemotaxis protein
MSVAVEISAYLPYLRRFARALTGSAEGGDAYVVATLEIIVAEPASFPRTLDSRSALYQLFLRLWSSTSATLPFRRSFVPHEPAERNLQQLAPLPRQAFLLRAMENFSLEETAAILRLTEVEVTSLLRQANAEIASQVATDVLIIEDEPIIALDIEGLVQDLGHHVLGIATTQGEAISMARANRPGLVLADIQLADGSSGLNAVNDILRDTDMPVVFITAFPERLLTGQKPEPAFLITKPFEPDAVKAVISQALFFDQRARRKVA